MAKLPRPLGYWETLCAAGHQEMKCSGMVPQIARFSGPLDPGQLRAALARVQLAHPLLGVKIIESETCFTFESSLANTHEERREAVPLTVIDRQDGHHWSRFTEAELLVDFPDEATCAWRIAYLKNKETDGDHELVLVFHHAISDGISTTRFVHDVLTCCTEDPRLEAAPFEQQLLEPVEKMLPPAEPFAPHKFFPSALMAVRAKLLATTTVFARSRYSRKLIVFSRNQFISVRSKYWTRLKSANPSPKHFFWPTLSKNFESIIEAITAQTAFHHPPSTIDKRMTRLDFRQLDAATLTAFRSRCKQAGTSVNGGIMAAFLLALHPNKETGIAPFGNAISLRGFCQPKDLDNRHFGCYVMVVGTVHKMVKRSNFWELARRCREDLKEVLAAAKKQGFLPRKFNKNDFKRMQGKGASALDKGGHFAMNGAMSNLGVLDFPEKYGPIHLKELYFATAQPTAHFAVALYLLTLHGKLFCCFSSCEPMYRLEEARRVADETLKLLRLESENAT